MAMCQTLIDMHQFHKTISYESIISSCPSYPPHLRSSPSAYSFLRCFPSLSSVVFYTTCFHPSCWVMLMLFIPFIHLPLSAFLLLRMFLPHDLHLYNFFLIIEHVLLHVFCLFKCFVRCIPCLISLSLSLSLTHLLTHFLFSTLWSSEPLSLWLQKEFPL